MDNSFTQDLLDGKWAEELFARIALKKLDATDVKFNTHESIVELRKWDLQFITRTGIERKFEVKWDKKSIDTGNFAVEMFGRSAESGISVTIADFWVTLSGKTFYITPVDKLKELIKSHNYRNVANCTRTAYVWLVPIADVKKISKLINTDVLKNNAVVTSEINN